MTISFALTHQQRSFDTYTSHNVKNPIFVQKVDFDKIYFEL